MIQLTTHQEALLTRLATGDTKNFAAQMSIPADGQVAATIDRHFAEAMQLVEWGLLFHVTSKPKIKEWVDRMLEEDGRTIVVLSSTPLVDMMFGRPTGVPN